MTMTTVMMMVMSIAKDDDNDNGNENDEQTHGIASRRRKLATLFIVAQWTLRKPVAPDHDHLDENEAKDTSDDHNDSDNGALGAFRVLCQTLS